jgi:hypothetical protein
LEVGPHHHRILCLAPVMKTGRRSDARAWCLGC